MSNSEYLRFCDLYPALLTVMRAIENGHPVGHDAVMRARRALRTANSGKQPDTACHCTACNARRGVATQTVDRSGANATMQAGGKSRRGQDLTDATPPMTEWKCRYCGGLNYAGETWEGVSCTDCGADYDSIPVRSKK